MDAVGIRELAERASAVVSEVERTGHPVLLTRRGRPVAVVIAIDEDALYDHVLAHAPEYVRDMREVEERYARGESDSLPLDEVLADLGEQDAGAEEGKGAGVPRMPEVRLTRSAERDLRRIGAGQQRTRLIAALRARARTRRTWTSRH